MDGHGITIAALLGALALLAAACRAGQPAAPSQPSVVPQPTPIEARGEGPKPGVTPPRASCDGAGPPVGLRAGERRTVRGVVLDTGQISAAQGTVTVLEVGGRGGGATLRVAIPERALGNFPEPPAQAYAGRDICVSGVVIDYYGSLAIIATLPEEIAVAG